MLKYFTLRSKELVLLTVMVVVVLLTIFLGTQPVWNGLAIRRWDWYNLLLILPVIPMVLLQPAAGLPDAAACSVQRRWMLPLLVGIVFGLLDVLVVRVIMHPEPLTALPPYLQPFPYSVFLYTAGALEVELYHRLIPLTVVMLVHRFVFSSAKRNWLVIITGILTSAAEPLLQFPSGPLWFVLYATISGFAMNAMQYWFYLQRGFLSSLLLRLGHYLIWHILLGLYVQYIELG